MGRFIGDLVQSKIDKTHIDESIAAAAAAMDMLYPLESQVHS